MGSQFLYAGAGYGGSCFPKDVKTLARSSAEAGVPSRILEAVEAVEAVNEAQQLVLVDKIVARLWPDRAGKTFAVWGLAFKPNTDDMREAPSRTVIAELAQSGARIRAYDPVARDEAARALTHIDGLQFTDSAADALAGAEALVIMTEWREFRTPDFESLRQALPVLARTQESTKSSTSATRCGGSCLIFSINTCSVTVIASTPLRWGVSSAD